MTRPTFQTAEPDMVDGRRHRQRIAAVLNSALTGKLNCTGIVTLTASTTSTTLTDPRLSAFSLVLFMPTTANAATAFATVYVNNQVKGAATINHASSANADQTFVYCVIG